jgi:hypothetical protein
MGFSATADCGDFASAENFNSSHLNSSFLVLPVFFFVIAQWFCASMQRLAGSMELNGPPQIQRQEATANSKAPA